MSAPGNPPEEHRFKKGQSGNPGGLPKRKPFADAYRRFAKMPIEEIEKLDPKKLTGAEGVALATIRDAIKGAVMAAKEAADRAEGKSIQTLELGGIDGAVIAVAHLTGAEAARELLTLQARDRELAAAMPALPPGPE